MKKCLPILLLLVHGTGTLSLAAQAPEATSVAPVSALAPVSADLVPTPSTAPPHAVQEGAFMRIPPPALSTASPPFDGIVPISSGDVLHPSTDAGEPSLLRHVAWGSLAGASAGLLTSALVLNWCDAYCEGSRARGMMLHVGIGAVVGAVAGAVVREIRR